ncbi:MAG TPA: iron ABC transporter permease [Tepidisphaeraceae bacterium]|nr:iron ABC transporter permease [Tepidisphaeraceae bacterium]
MTSVAAEPLRDHASATRKSRRSAAPPQTVHVVLAALLYLFFAALLIWPIVQIVKTGFTRPDGSLTFAYLGLVFQDAGLVRGLANATIVAVLVTLLTLVVSLPLAILSVRYTFPLRGLLNGLLLVPLVLPPFVGAIGMQIVLGRYGPLTQLVGGGGPLGIDWIGKFPLLGIVVIEALHLYPVMLLNIQASLANLDPAMEQAAANLGASPGRIFWQITRPMIQPGLFAGCTLVMIWSFTELGTPLMFGFYTITPVQVFHQINEVAGNPVPYALVVVMLLASAALYLVGKVILGRGFEAATTKASVAATSQKLSGWKGLAAAMCFLLVFLLAVVPHISVILTSFSATGAWYKSILPAHFTLDHYRAALTDPLALPSVKRSLQYASCATALAVVVGLAAAIVIVRSSVPGRWLIDALAMLPLAVPGLVLSFGYLSISIWFKRKLGSRTPFFLDVQEWPAVVLVLAYAARRLPYVVRAAVAGLQQTPRDLELAAANLGAGRWTVLRRITLPLILASLIAGGLLAFAFAMLEVSDSLILAQRMQYYPITKAILDLSMRLGDGLYIASALGVWAMLLLTLTILAANALLGKKIGAVFRL